MMGFYLFLSVIAGALVGALLVYVVLRSKQFALQTAVEVAQKEAQYAQIRLQEERALAQKQLQEERAHADKLRREADERWNQKLEAFKSEISRITVEQ